MTARHHGAPSLGFDAFGGAVGLAVISGALAIVVPSLAVLTGTLAALAVAAWAVGGRAAAAGGGRRGGLRAAGEGTVVAAAALLYLDPVHGYAPFRSLGLALALVLFWAGTASGPRRPHSEAR